MKRNYVKPGMVIVQLAQKVSIMDASNYAKSYRGNAFDGDIVSGTGAGRTKEQSVWDEEW